MAAVLRQAVNGLVSSAPDADTTGWSALVAELRADRLRSQLDTANVALQDAARRAEETERGR